RTGHLVSVAGPGALQSLPTCAATGSMLIQVLDTTDRGRCAISPDLYDARLDPREGGREVECQEAKRVGRSGAFAFEETAYVREECPQAALERPRPRASLDLRRHAAGSRARRVPQPHRQAQ